MTRPTRMEQPPRKVTLATVLGLFQGSATQRVEAIARCVGDAARAAREQGLRPVDLVVFPENAIESGNPGLAADRAVTLDSVATPLGQIAREHAAYVVAPMFLAEADGLVSNAAVLFDRSGNVAGIYRKIHPVAFPDGTLEAGVTAGRDVPTFACDFGTLGIQICWDIAYDDGWDQLARQNAELVVVPSASPATLRLIAHAIRCGFYIASSTPRDNATLFNPIGQTACQRTTPGVLVHTIDLAYAILHWSPTLNDGQLLTNLFGRRVGYQYSPREDTGIFWSNDPTTTIGQMVREAGLQEMSHAVHESARLKAR